MKYKSVFLAILLLSLNILFCTPAYSYSENTRTDNVNRLEYLSNSQIAAMIKNEKYNNWALYQPTARESEVSTSSESFLSTIAVYPVIAIHNDDVHLIVLNKFDSAWKIAFINELALVREGFKLIGFSLAEESSGVNGIQYVFFDFIDENNKEYELVLQLSDLYPSYFSALHFDNRTLLLNYDRGLTYKIEYPFLMTLSFEFDPHPYIPFDAGNFSLQRLPITLESLIVPAKVSATDSRVALYIIPDAASQPITHLANGEDIAVIYPQSASEWVMVYFMDNILFIPKCNVNILGE